MSAAMGAALFAATGVPGLGGSYRAPMGPLDSYEIAPGHHVEEWTVLVVCCSAPGIEYEPHWKGTRHVFFTRWRLRRDLARHLREAQLKVR